MHNLAARDVPDDDVVVSARGHQESPVRAERDSVDEIRMAVAPALLAGCCPQTDHGLGRLSLAPPAPVARFDGGRRRLDGRLTELHGWSRDLNVSSSDRPVRSRRDDDVAPRELRGYYRPARPRSSWIGRPSAAHVLAVSSPLAVTTMPPGPNATSSTGPVCPYEGSHEGAGSATPDPCRLIRAAGCDAVARRVERNDDHLAGMASQSPTPSTSEDPRDAPSDRPRRWRRGDPTTRTPHR